MNTAQSSSIPEGELKVRLQNMDDYDFEHFIADLWERQGWRSRVEQQSTDRGVDVVIEKDTPFSQKWLVQAKRYSDKVGGPEIREYVSLQHRQGVDGAVVVSTDYFTKQAHQEEKEYNLKLVDFDGLIQMIGETNSFDLLDKYISIESSSRSSSHLDQCIDNKSVASSQPSNQTESRSLNQSNHSEVSAGQTRLHKHFSKVETGKDIEEGLNGLHQVLFEQPPRTNW